MVRKQRIYRNIAKRMKNFVVEIKGSASWGDQILARSKTLIWELHGCCIIPCSDSTRRNALILHHLIAGFKPLFYDVVSTQQGESTVGKSKKKGNRKWQYWWKWIIMPCWVMIYGYKEGGKDTGDEHGRRWCRAHVQLENHVQYQNNQIGDEESEKH